MCKATGNSHHAPVKFFKLCFEFGNFTSILNMGPKLRASSLPADEPSEELQDIRKNWANCVQIDISKSLQQQRSKRKQIQTQEISLVNLHLHKQLKQLNQQVKNDKIYELICTIIFFYLYKMYVKKPEKDKQFRK